MEDGKGKTDRRFSFPSPLSPSSYSLLPHLAEGLSSFAEGLSSFAEGLSSFAEGLSSFAEGL